MVITQTNPNPHCYRSTATVTAGTGTSSVCTDTFVMSCSSIAEVHVVCSTSKARTQWRSADWEKSEFVGPSDSRTKPSAADLSSKQPEHRGPPSSALTACATRHLQDENPAVMSEWAIENIYTSASLSAAALLFSLKRIIVSNIYLIYI